MKAWPKTNRPRLTHHTRARRSIYFYLFSFKMGIIIFSGIIDNNRYKLARILPKTDKKIEYMHEIEQAKLISF
jgi:hypothetical protein